MNALFEIVRCTYNQSELHGLALRPPRPVGCVIHFHGTGGNFYSNPFIEPIGLAVSSLDLAYFTVNLPGHDETAETERFTDCVGAIDSWIDALGCADGHLFLQGHSLGALKVLHYLGSSDARHRARVRAIVLLSPFDVVAFYCKGKPDAVDAIRARVAAEMQSFGPSTRVPKEVFDLWPLSVGTFLELVKPGGVADTFPSRATLHGSPLDSLGLPAFVAIGAEDFAAFPLPQRVVDEVRQLGGRLAVHLIGRAPHNFSGHADSLADLLRGWLCDHLG